MKAMVKIALEKILKQLKNPNSGRGLNVVSGHVVEKESVGFCPAGVPKN